MTNSTTTTPAAARKSSTVPWKPEPKSASSSSSFADPTSGDAHHHQRTNQQQRRKQGAGIVDEAPYTHQDDDTSFAKQQPHVAAAAETQKDHHPDQPGQPLLDYSHPQYHGFDSVGDGMQPLLSSRHHAGVRRSIINERSQSSIHEIRRHVAKSGPYCGLWIASTEMGWTLSMSASRVYLAPSPMPSPSSSLLSSQHRLSSSSTMIPTVWWRNISEFQVPVYAGPNYQSKKITVINLGRGIAVDDFFEATAEIDLPPSATTTTTHNHSSRNPTPLKLKKEVTWLHIQRLPANHQQFPNLTGDLWCPLGNPFISERKERDASLHPSVGRKEGSEGERGHKWSTGGGLLYFVPDSQTDLQSKRWLTKSTWIEKKRGVNDGGHEIAADEHDDYNQPSRSTLPTPRGGGGDVNGGSSFRRPIRVRSEIFATTGGQEGDVDDALKEQPLATTRSSRLAESFRRRQSLNQALCAHPATATAGGGSQTGSREGEEVLQLLLQQQHEPGDHNADHRRGGGPLSTGASLGGSLNEPFSSPGGTTTCSNSEANLSPLLAGGKSRSKSSGGTSSGGGGDALLASSSYSSWNNRLHHSVRNNHPSSSSFSRRAFLSSSKRGGSSFTTAGGGVGSTNELRQRVDRVLQKIGPPTAVFLRAYEDLDETSQVSIFKTAVVVGDWEYSFNQSGILVRPASEGAPFVRDANLVEHRGTTTYTHEYVVNELLEQMKKSSAAGGRTNRSTSSSLQQSIKEEGGQEEYPPSMKEIKQQSPLLLQEGVNIPTNNKMRFTTTVATVAVSQDLREGQQEVVTGETQEGGFGPELHSDDSAATYENIHHQHQEFQFLDSHKSAFVAYSYDADSHNCHHFCEALMSHLDLPEIHVPEKWSIVPEAGRVDGTGNILPSLSRHMSTPFSARQLVVSAMGANKAKNKFLQVLSSGGGGPSTGGRKSSQQEQELRSAGSPPSSLASASEATIPQNIMTRAPASTRRSDDSQVVEMRALPRVYEQVG